MDQLHHALFKTMNELSSAQDKDFSDGYNGLVREVEHAFRTEEQWMEEIDFQPLKVHQEQHARVLGALHNVHSRIMAGELSSGRAVVKDLLPQWLAFHISTMDMTLARALEIASIRTMHHATNIAEDASALLSLGE